MKIGSCLRPHSPLHPRSPRWENKQFYSWIRNPQKIIMEAKALDEEQKKNSKKETNFAHREATYPARHENLSPFKTKFPMSREKKGIHPRRQTKKPFETWKKPSHFSQSSSFGVTPNSHVTLHSDVTLARGQAVRPKEFNPTSAYHFRKTYLWMILDRFILLLGSPRRKTRIIELHEEVLYYNEKLHYTYKLVCWSISCLTILPAFLFLLHADLCLPSSHRTLSFPFDPDSFAGHMVSCFSFLNSFFIFHLLVKILIFALWVELTNRIRYYIYLKWLAKLWIRCGWTGYRAPFLLSWFESFTNRILRRKKGTLECGFI